MRDLTPRQKQILQLVQRAMHESGMPPTRAEIAKTLKFRSVNAAEEHLRALERKGVIELLPGMSRGIRLKDSLREQMGLPLVGRVAAGQPIASRARHEHARCRNFGWRLGRSASHTRGASSTNHRRAVGQRSHRQTV
jgi:repressor LexA